MTWDVVIRCHTRTVLRGWSSDVDNVTRSNTDSCRLGGVVPRAADLGVSLVVVRHGQHLDVHGHTLTARMHPTTACATSMQPTTAHSGVRL
jgi:hypothetical protein